MQLKLSYLAYTLIAIAFISLLFGFSQATKPGQHSVGSYWGPVEKAIGKSGTMLPGGVFKVDLTRGDVAVAVGGVRLKPVMATDSWVSFMRMGDEAMMMGDIVLTSEEVGPVQAKLSAEGIDITAIHNTLIGESPRLYDLHIGGRGDPAMLATKVRIALDTARISSAGESPRPERHAPAVGQLDRAMGSEYTLEDGVYMFSIPRAERITVDGMEMPPSMDVATMIKFQPLGDGNVAATGDFLLRPDEVQPVIRALNENGIEVTALHSHMLVEEPRLFMLHFWAMGDEYRLANGLRLALNNTNSIPIKAGLAYR
ncbi:DUF1259 domain-containing protein [Methanocella conradii]|uniref:DUF1259 domain-containing protein n=1 Tax=Methanocella conradii TaxID=1175444 RepID=UPI0024B3AD3E|nr:DUF1259 domain-containing protein [Methanocella conradii]MDI6895803.1 DUF1259 domain-containing protein [Methanocella conradii]